MSEAGKYDGETLPRRVCKTCLAYAMPQETCRRTDKDTDAMDICSMWLVDPDYEVQCRQVRALERIADSLDEFGGCLRSDGRGGCTFDVTVQP